MTKILHFNISGNRWFKDEEPSIIIEDLGYCLEELKSEEEDIAKHEYFYNHHTTLRDIAVLLYEACSVGVEWNFARELANELGIDKKDAQIALSKIVRKYATMTEEEAMDKYNKLAKYVKIHDIMPDEKE